MQNLAVVIDDDIDDIELMSEALQIVDPTLKLATFLDGITAITWLSNSNGTRPYLIFVDLNMQPLRGENVLLELRKQFADNETHIVMYSTSMPKDVAQQLIRRGATSVFEKPNRFENYLTILRKIMSS